MTLDLLFSTLRQKTGATEERPFGPEVIVFKVGGKMFALVAWQETPLRLTLKCVPDHAQALRAIYPAVTAGYHMNKRHWNTIILDGSVPEEELWEMIDESYTLVVGKLTKKLRKALGLL